MPPKPSNKDIKEVVTLVNSVWPEFPITQSTLINPTKASVVSFYINFLRDCNSKLSEIYNIDLKFNELADTGFPPEVYITNKMKLILQVLNFNCDFCLVDIYKPEPKRTVKFFKLLSHFIGYSTNLMESVNKLAADSFKIAEKAEQLDSQKQKLLQTIATRSEKIANDKDTRKHLLKETNTWTKTLQSIDMSAIGKQENDKIIEIASHQNEHDLEQQDLIKLEEKEVKYKEMLVAEENMEKSNLRKKSSYLELEQLDVDLQGISETVTTQSKELELESDSGRLKNLTINYSDLQVISDLKKPLKNVLGENQKIVTQSSAVRNEKRHLKREIGNLHLQLDSDEKQLEHLHNKNIKDANEIQNTVDQCHKKSLKEREQFKEVQKQGQNEGIFTLAGSYCEKEGQSKKGHKWVYFFGTHNYAWIEPKFIHQYAQFKEKFSKCKTHLFKEGLEEIEEFIVERNKDPNYEWKVGPALEDSIEESEQTPTPKKPKAEKRRSESSIKTSAKKIRKSPVIKRESREENGLNDSIHSHVSNELLNIPAVMLLQPRFELQKGRHNSTEEKNRHQLVPRGVWGKTGSISLELRSDYNTCSKPLASV